MTYPVDKPDVRKNVKVGDQIMATVYQRRCDPSQCRSYAAGQIGEGEIQTRTGTVPLVPASFLSSQHLDGSPASRARSAVQS
jgi:hypothetical protein